jgi:hypothetical protein
MNSVLQTATTEAVGLGGWKSFQGMVLSKIKYTGSVVIPQSNWATAAFQISIGLFTLRKQHQYLVNEVEQQNTHISGVSSRFKSAGRSCHSEKEIQHKLIFSCLNEAPTFRLGGVVDAKPKSPSDTLDAIDEATRQLTWKFTLSVAGHLQIRRR